jgi:serine/threonine protein kinase
VDNNFKNIDPWCRLAEAKRMEGAPLEGSFVNAPPERAILGKGAFGVVWRAAHRDSRDHYAVKNVKASRSNSVTFRECEIADHIRSVPHPCVVNVLAVHRFSDMNMYCLVMEFCSEGELTSHLAKHTRRKSQAGDAYTPPKEALPWIGQIFLGLEHMHKRMKLMLRDLKPDNVVIDHNRVAKLTDFGFGKAGILAQGWSFGHPLGTPGYIAPEMLNKRGQHTFKADLYSYGVLVWVVLSGGCKSLPYPRPPTNWSKRNHGADFQALENDHQKMRIEVQRGGKAAISQDARDLVMDLVNVCVDDRLDHEGIRGSRFVQQLCLPSVDDGPSKVSEWLRLHARND